MSKLDKTKVYIDFLKSIIITLFVGLFGMASYLVINIETISSLQAIITTIGIVLDIMVLLVLVKITIKKINALEEL
jgi:hypothetical protein